MSFTRALAAQVGGERGIRVNAVAPGPVHTPLQPASRPGEQMESFGYASQSRLIWKWKLTFESESTMLGRPAQPSEIAPSYVFLASSEAAAFIGQVSECPGSIA